MIASFNDREAERLFQGYRSKRLPPGIQRAAYRKLLMLDAAESLEDLRVPPSNRLEALKGDRTGFYSIRINKQWRLVFRWSESQAHDVSVVDYH